MGRGRHLSLWDRFILSPRPWLCWAPLALAMLGPLCRPGSHPELATEPPALLPAPRLLHDGVHTACSLWLNYTRGDQPWCWPPPLKSPRRCHPSQPSKGGSGALICPKPVCIPRTRSKMGHGWGRQGHGPPVLQKLETARWGRGAHVWDGHAQKPRLLKTRLASRLLCPPPRAPERRRRSFVGGVSMGPASVLPCQPQLQDRKRGLSPALYPWGKEGPESRSPSTRVQQGQLAGGLVVPSAPLLTAGGRDCCAPPGRAGSQTASQHHP